MMRRACIGLLAAWALIAALAAAAPATAAPVLARDAADAQPAAPAAGGIAAGNRYISPIFLCFLAELHKFESLNTNLLFSYVDILFALGT